ncbi:conserved hypothetical protein [Phenylobacterium zucineum HLK1]|uniref:DUF2842 domain-containing protein n=1 Tax=Phenylobacterium zucineum (strain HLK1) TaxID=450851 RepID=B4RB15_PHEZH|nr:DUF2842 domain-containing protein [Phenylobacterium zucineum]ACG78066.1 conserved hypothetical protein [Phenylobacterium zucineum HLK1]
MSARVRKLIGLFAILGFLALYVVAAVFVGERIPERWWAQLPYYAVVGFCWWLPLAPLFRWMSRGR